MKKCFSVLKITFKNVGQGDSIILEWYSNKKKRFGIIDCNMLNSSNPVLEHMINNRVDEIEFLILSHPHKDHFSGFKNLLEYCRLNKLRVKTFYHTAQITPDYLKSASRSIESGNALFELFYLLKDMKAKDEIKVYAIDDNPNFQIELDDEFKLEVLAPSSVEIDNYIKGVAFPFDEEESVSNPNANWLSTIIKISNHTKSILLTSDAEASVLDRLIKKETERVNNSCCFLAQTPHHGSKKNLNKKFWESISKDNFTPLIISVGKNRYMHPSEELIEYFNHSESYRLFRTDSMSNDVLMSKEQKKISSLLDLYSSKEVSQAYGSDRSFEVANNDIHIV